MIHANWTKKMLLIYEELQQASSQEQDNVSTDLREICLKSTCKLKPLIHCLLQWVKIKSSAVAAAKENKI